MSDGKHKKFEHEEFFNRIYNDYYSHVYRRVNRTLFSKIEDDVTSCMQEIFIKAWSNIENLRKHESVKGWFEVVARNTVNNFNKQYSRHQKLFADSPDIENIIQERDFTQETAEEAEFQEFIKSNTAEKFINQLSESERQLYELKFQQKLNNTETGKILNITSNAVASRSKRLIQKFKKEFLQSENKK